MSLTRQLREELAHAEVRTGPSRLAEASAMVRFGGTLRLRGGARQPLVSVVVQCAQGAVARRLRQTLIEALDVKPGLAQIRGGNLSGSAGYLVEIATTSLFPLGVLDGDGRPLQGISQAYRRHRFAYTAGVLMVAGRLSGPGQPVHLEVRAPGERTAADLGELLGATVSGTRVLMKGGAAVADLLAAVRAHSTFLAFDEGRMRRDLRRHVNRTVNADRANLRRTADAASAQIAGIQAVVDTVGWDGLPHNLRDVALARLVNPESSLTELGKLLDPPIGKATVHRRLKALEVMASRLDPTS